jgi:hypothetical protein
MADEAAPLTRYDLEAKIVKRCWEDEAFHKEFATDPIGTAVKYLQVPAESLPNIVVHEEPAGSWHIVLPAKPANAGELSEEDLEKVAGGSTPACSATALGAALYALFAASAFSAAGAGSAVTASAIVTVDRGW